MATEGSNGFGQWLTPDDARRITASCNQVGTPVRQANTPLHGDQPGGMSEMDIIAAQQEEDDLNAAIAASLMDTGGPFANLDSAQEYSKPHDALVIETPSSTMSKENNQEEADKSEQCMPPVEDTKEPASGSDMIKEVSSTERKEAVKED